MHAVVTGGAGFIGSNLTDELIKRGFQVTIIDDLSTGQRSNLNPKARLVEGSICDLKLMQSVLPEADYVFHLAALPRIQPSFEDPLGHEEVNVVGTINCLLALKGSSRLKKFVYSASSACYGTPTELPTTETALISPLSPYALQKYSAEQYALMLGERYEIPVVALRYFNVYGPRSFNEKNPFNAYSSVIGIFNHQKGAGKPLTVTGDGSQERDFVHVFDVVQANILGATSDKHGQVYNVGAGKTISILELANLYNSEIVFTPERKGEARVTWANNTKLRTELGWKPSVSLEQGLGLNG